MRLYHGTNIDFSDIDLNQCLPYKDFGQGFYLTQHRDQAERMAARKSRRSGVPIVQEYEFDKESLCDDSLLIKTFEEPNEEWALFILSNRERRNPSFTHPYDIVIGPVADDGVAYTLARYLEGSYTISDVVKELRFKHLNSQYCFCSLRSLSLLKRIKP